MNTDRFGYRILVEWHDEDQIYVARVPALLGCLAHGDSPAKAVREVHAAAEAMLSVLREDGEPLPPTDAAVSYSGNIRLRLPVTLHRQLDELANADGVSLNTLMVSILSEGLGKREARRNASPTPQIPAFGPYPSPRRRVAAGLGPIPKVAEPQVRDGRRTVSGKKGK